ncbi:MAG: UDP-N-acetylmuramoyl-L-alanyl-D-glutamate--2,6-diaminopimelate ligase, partial [Actinobacteria bacterium]|nr:UDP-N-acetylmuramoyl-L-alanyl-D-glutamate--2,6-diaminopimelate ligase [Actinomycetota bacterium]
MHAHHKLADLAGAAGDVVTRIEGDGTITVEGLSFDSRSIAPGDLFFCVRGLVADGHGFAPAALASGAVALCVERDLGLGVPEVVVSDARIAMARISAAFFEYPADQMTMLGVTGTNGKTTTAFLLESILTAAGRAPGLIGTIQTRVGDHVSPGIRTTPESLDLQKLLAEMRAAG